MYRNTVLICGGTGCHSNHSAEIYDKFVEEIAAKGIKEDVLLDTTTKVYSGDVLYVGNTASVSGGHETIGKPFNVGINAAFAAWKRFGNADCLWR